MFSVSDPFLVISGPWDPFWSLFKDLFRLCDSWVSFVSFLGALPRRAGAFWGRLGLPGASWGSFGVFWRFLGPPGASWDSFGDVWVLPGPPGASWVSCGFLGLDCIRTEFCVLAFPREIWRSDISLALKIHILAAIPKGNLSFRRLAGT